MASNKCNMTKDTVDEKIRKFPMSTCNDCENYLEEDGTYICTKPLEFGGDK